MKANELMIGDWVNLNYWDGKFVQQINGISYNSWRGEGYSDWVDTEIDDEASIDSIEPIPLTAEILEKNGFETIEEISVYHEDGTIGDGMWQNDKLCCGYDNTEGNFEFYTFSYDPEEEGIQQIIQKIFYVHELQHALRLCGLNELADNFKVE